MKKLVVILLVFVSASAISQTTAEIFDYKAMTFYGLDFSNAKCIGKTEFPEAKEVIDIYFRQWNEMYLNEENPFKIGKPYKKKEIEFDTASFEYNSKINPDELITDDPHVFQRSDIQGYVNKYANSDAIGIGMVYLVEALNAEEEYLSIWVTFINNSTGEVLLTEPLRSKSKGRKFGPRWEQAIYKLFSESAYDYKAWKGIYR